MTPTSSLRNGRPINSEKYLLLAAKMFGCRNCRWHELCHRFRKGQIDGPATRHAMIEQFLSYFEFVRKASHAVRPPVLSGMLALIFMGVQLHAASPTKGKPDETGNPIVDPQDKSQPAKGKKPPGSFEELENPGLANPPDNLKKVLDDFKATKARFLEDQKKLQKLLQSSAAADIRRQIRDEIKDKREAFLEQQKEIREEVQKRMVEMKDQLKDHKELLDETKEQAKEKVRQRRGGDN
jgi:hypothetical protein